MTLYTERTHHRGMTYPALNLNIHFHMLFLDGGHEVAPDGTRLRFRWVRGTLGHPERRPKPAVDQALKFRCLERASNPPEPQVMGRCS